MSYKFLGLTLASLFTSYSFALVHKFDPKQGQVVFLAKGKPAMIKIEGTGKGVAGELIEKDGILNGALKFDLASLDTKMDLRNEHMKEKYLEVKKYPNAILHIKDLKLPKDQTTFDFTGEMEIKEVKKPVKGKITLDKNAEGKTKIKADFPIKISDYPSIGVPSYLGVTVAEEVKVTVDTEALAAK